MGPLQMGCLARPIETFSFKANFVSSVIVTMHGEDTLITSKAWKTIILSCSNILSSESQYEVYFLTEDRTAAQNCIWVRILSCREACYVFILWRPREGESIVNCTTSDCRRKTPFPYVQNISKKLFSTSRSTVLGHLVFCLLGVSKWKTLQIYNPLPTVHYTTYELYHFIMICV